MAEIINNAEFLNKTAEILESQQLDSKNKTNVVNILAYSAGALINLYLSGEIALDAAELAVNWTSHNCHLTEIPDQSMHSTDDHVREWMTKGVAEIPGLTLMQVTTQLHALELKSKEPTPDEVYNALIEFIMGISTVICSVTSTESLRNQLYSTALRWLNFGLKFDILEQLCVPLTQCTSPFHFPDPDEFFSDFMEEEMFKGNVPVDTRGQVFH